LIGGSSYSNRGRGDRRGPRARSVKLETSVVILRKSVAGLTRQSLERFVLRARRAVGLQGGINVLVTGSTAVRALNRQFRGKDKTTDVLSFPSPPGSSTVGRGPADAGDIAISADIAAQNAARFGHSAAEEVKILALHGILHLAGFDHERDNNQMARKEMKLRRTLQLPVALIERNQAAARRSSTKRPGRRLLAGSRSTA
jgi:probable rRNA maturation factor